MHSIPCSSLFPPLNIPSFQTYSKQNNKMYFSIPSFIFPVLLFLSSTQFSFASLYQSPPTVLTYHNGPVLQGHIPISLVWYGSFTAKQKSIITDFILSLTPRDTLPTSHSLAPTIAKWWQTVDYYVQNVAKTKTQILLTNQLTEESYSLGKLLTHSDLSSLALRLGVIQGGLAIVLTSADVAVDKFCMNTCGLHSASYIWVGDSSMQCPGKCAWPFHEPEFYGPRRGVVVKPPNDDVGIDGMIINLASLLAGVVTNPFGDGYFQGDAEAPVEVAAACPGVFGRGAYPGYPGQLKIDKNNGGSYNVEGRNGRKFLVPALVDPASHSCQTLV